MKLRAEPEKTPQAALLPAAVNAWDNLIYPGPRPQSERPLLAGRDIHNLTLAVTSSPGYDTLLVRRDDVIQA